MSGLVGYDSSDDEDNDDRSNLEVRLIVYLSTVFFKLAERSDTRPRRQTWHIQQTLSRIVGLLFNVQYSG